MKEGPLCACGNLRKAVRAVTHFYDEALRPTGLRATQVALLGACGMLGGVTMNRLAEFLVMDRTTLTRNLRPLQRERLIRIKAGKDQREREVTITKQGVGTLMKVYPLWKKAQSQVVEGLGQERMSRFLSDLSTLVEVTQAK